MQLKNSTRTSPILITGIGILSIFAITLNSPVPTFAAGIPFLDTFNGNPSTPQAFSVDSSSSNWDIAVQSRDEATWEKLEEMDAHHGADCSSPLDASGNLITHHQTGSYEQSVFKCKDHLMTSIKAGGYGLIYLTPNQIVDFTDGEAVIKVDVTTLRTSGRDWWDIWVTPFEENLQLPFNTGDVDLNGVPRNAVHISNEGSANGAGTGFTPRIYKNFVDSNEFPGFSDTYNWWTGYEGFMNVSPKQRTTFELRLSKNRLKFCIPAGQIDEKGLPVNNGQEFCWVDKQLSTPLDWSKGIVQFGHHSYNPEKDCTPDPTKKTCSPNTWHWDTVSISNATPFTIIKADKRMTDGSGTNNAITFNSPAPTNAFMRFSAIGRVEYSLDNGSSWQIAPKQPSSTLQNNTYHYEHLTSYFVPIPAGTTTAKFRFSQDSWYQGPYQAKDFTIWSLNAPSPPSTAPSTQPSPSPALRKSGDVDGNDVINIFDYNEVLTNFGKITGFNILTDFDNNGAIDIFDYNEVLTNFGK